MMELTRRSASGHDGGDTQTGSAYLSGQLPLVYSGVLRRRRWPISPVHTMYSSICAVVPLVTPPRHYCGWLWIHGFPASFEIASRPSDSQTSDSSQSRFSGHGGNLPLLPAASTDRRPRIEDWRCSLCKAIHASPDRTQARLNGTDHKDSFRCFVWQREMLVLKRKSFSDWLIQRLARSRSLPILSPESGLRKH